MKEKIDKTKDRKNREAVALRDNLKRRKIFQKKIKRKQHNVHSARLLDKKNV